MYGYYCMSEICGSNYVFFHEKDHEKRRRYGDMVYYFEKNYTEVKDVRINKLLVKLTSREASLL
jgi:hypothetical protein